MTLADTPPGAQDVASPNWTSRLLGLTRDPAKGKLSGLARALADFYGLDPVVIRLFFVIAAFGSGVGILIYLVGWLITNDVRTGTAPMDRIMPSWRHHSPSTILGWAISIIAVIGIGLSALMPYGWIPLAIVVLAILTSRNGHYQATSRIDQDSAAVDSARRRIVLPSVVILSAGAAVGISTYLYSQGNLMEALALILGTIGVGLVLVSFHATPFPVIIVGLALSAALVTGVGATTANDSVNRMMQHRSYLTPPYTYVNDVYAIRELSISNGPRTLDLSAAPVTVDWEWQVHATDASLLFILPADTDIDITVVHTDITVVHTDQPTNSPASETTEPLVEHFYSDSDIPGQHMSIAVVATNSDIRVIRS